MVRCRLVFLLLACLVPFCGAREARGELLGYWSADLTAGQGDVLLNDLEDPDLDGEMVDVSYSADSQGHTGEAGDYALQFEGFDEDYVAIPPIEEFFEAITLTAWVNGVPNGGWTGLIVSRDPVSPLYLGFYGETTDLAYVWNDNSGDTWGWVSGVSVSEDEWTFVALTVEEDQATMFAGQKGGELQYASNEIEHFEQESLTEWRLAEDDCCGGTRNFAGLMDDVSIWNEALDIEQLEALHAGTETPLTLAGIGGDPLDPLNDGTLAGPAERADYVHNVLGTWVGDSNLDGEFNSSDFVVVFTAGEYEDGVLGNSSWVTGDWDGDQEFNSSDFVAAFMDGGFEQGARPAAQAVPEPNAVVLLCFAGLVGMATGRRNLIRSSISSE